MSDQAASMCQGKITHATASGAHVALKRQTERWRFRRIKGATLDAYRCPICTGWHIGNSQDFR